MSPQCSTPNSTRRSSRLAAPGSKFTAVGGAFDSLLAAGSLETLTLTGTTGVLDTRTVTTGTLGVAGPLLFFGYVVTGDTIVSITSSQTDLFAGLDNFRYGFGGAAVPEPSSLVLSGLAALTGLGLRRWTRRIPDVA